LIKLLCFRVPFMINRRVIISFALISLAGCVSNPLNRVTSDRYSETCSVAERHGNLGVAEEACYRALVNTYWGNLGDELKSEKLYNLARIKRQLSKFSEAESLLEQSLEIEEARSEVVNEKIGRRLVELSINLAAMGRWEEGALSLERVVPIADQYSGSEKDTIIMVFIEYGKHFSQSEQEKKANQFISQARNLQRNK